MNGNLANLTWESLDLLKYLRHSNKIVNVSVDIRLIWKDIKALPWALRLSCTRSFSHFPFNFRYTMNSWNVDMRNWSILKTHHHERVRCCRSISRTSHRTSRKFYYFTTHYAIRERSSIKSAALAFHLTFLSNTLEFRSVSRKFF